MELKSETGLNEEELKALSVEALDQMQVTKTLLNPF